MAIYSGFSHRKWWFSMAMLNYQRVYDHMEVSWNGGTPKSFILMGCSIINQPCWIAPSMEAPIYERISRYDLGYPLGFRRLDEAIGCWTVTWWLSYHKISSEFLEFFFFCNSLKIWLDDMNLDSHFSWWLIKWSDFNQRLTHRLKRDARSVVGTSRGRQNAPRPAMTWLATAIV